MEPEEDKHLEKLPPDFSFTKVCVHDWMDMYGGSGVRKDRPTVALQAFFCRKCLKIAIKSYDQSIYKMKWDED